MMMMMMMMMMMIIIIIIAVIYFNHRQENLTGFCGIEHNNLYLITVRCDEGLPPQAPLVTADPVTKTIPKKIAFYSTGQVIT